MQHERPQVSKNRCFRFDMVWRDFKYNPLVQVVSRDDVVVDDVAFSALPLKKAGGMMLRYQQCGMITCHFVTPQEARRLGPFSTRT